VEITKTSVLLVGHGSREGGANTDFEALCAAYAAHSPWPVRHAYIELARPLLEDALLELAAESEEVLVAPLLLFSGPHLKNDFPLAIARARAKFPEVRFVLCPALGVHPHMVEALYAQVEPLIDDPASTALVVVGRGASDPDANSDLFKLVRLAVEGRGLAAVDIGFIGVTQPSLEAALERAQRQRPTRVVVAPYMLFAGRLIARVNEQVAQFASRTPWISFQIAATLGAHPGVLAALRERIESAQRGEGALPCDTCQYRQAIGKVSQEVGGLRALLWSVRHSVTHGQAMPHVHAHKPLVKHVLVCTNADCADRGSLAVVSGLRRELKSQGQMERIRVTRTGCMGRCGEGPTLVIYPDGVWYRGVREGDVQALVHEHLLGDRLVAKLVDNIMG
jgi:sirohydrochlorin ferrochelatase/(2Fe-2S) ferredoxin